VRIGRLRGLGFLEHCDGPRLRRSSRFGLVGPDPPSALSALRFGGRGPVRQLQEACQYKRRDGDGPQRQRADHRGHRDGDKGKHQDGQNSSAPPAGAARLPHVGGLGFGLVDGWFGWWEMHGLVPSLRPSAAGES